VNGPAAIFILVLTGKCTLVNVMSSPQGPAQRLLRTMSHDMIRSLRPAHESSSRRRLHAMNDGASMT